MLTFLCTSAMIWRHIDVFIEESTQVKTSEKSTIHYVRPLDMESIFKLMQDLTSRH